MKRKKNRKIYVKIKNDKKEIETYVDGEEGFKNLFNITKNEIFGGKDNKKKPPGFIKNEKNERGIN